MNYSKREEKTKRRAKKMLPAIRDLISFRSIHDVDKDRTELAKELIADIKDSFPKETPPGEATLIKMISENRNKEGDPEDHPWSMLGYAKSGIDESRYQLTAKDNEAILRVRKMQLHKGDNFSKSMSVRQALWIARLYAIVDKIHADKTEDDKAYWLWMYSFQYAIREKAAILSKKKLFSSRELDDAMSEGHEKFKETYEKDFFANRKDLEGFYLSHFLNGDENKKAGAK